MNGAAPPPTVFLSERFSDIYELDYDEEPIVEQSVRNTAPVSLC